MVLVQRLTLLTANLWDGHELLRAQSKAKDASHEQPGHQLERNGGSDRSKSKLTPICEHYAVL